LRIRPFDPGQATLNGIRVEGWLGFDFRREIGSAFDASGCENFKALVAGLKVAFLKLGS
jgi:hypothetical protein